MRIFVRKGTFISKFRRAAAGLGLGAVFALLGTAALPVPALAITPSCFLKAECIDLNEASGGNCDSKHCWEKGGDCPGTSGRCYAKWPSQELSVNIGVTKVANFGDYLVKLYDAGFAVAGIMAATMIVIGGLYVATAGGNSSQVGKGQKIIKDALVGLFIAAGAYVILQTVNPDLVHFKLPKILVVKKQRLGQCKGIEQCVPCGERFIALLPKNTQDDLGGGLTSGWVDLDCSDPSVQNRILKFGSSMTDALATKYDEGPECVGKSCQLLNSFCKDESHKCVIKPSGAAMPNGCQISASTAQQLCQPDRPGGAGEIVDAGTPCPPGTHVDTSGGAVDAPTDNNEYYCKECIANGQSGCTVTAGESDECCSGFCAAGGGAARNIVAGSSDGGLGTCTNGDFGATCNSNAQCKSGICNLEWFSGRCVSGTVGSPCNSDDHCKGGNYCSNWNHLCTPGNEYNYCNNDGNCKGGLVCRQVKGIWGSTGSIVGSAAAGSSTGCVACNIDTFRSGFTTLCKICDAVQGKGAEMGNAFLNGEFKICIEPDKKFTTCGTCNTVKGIKESTACTILPLCKSAVSELENALSCNSSTTTDGCPNATPFCSDAIGTACTSGLPGTPCTEDNDCANRKCGGCKDGTFESCNRVCSKPTEMGAACRVDDDCKAISGATSPQCVCVSSGVFENICNCTTGSLGSPCNDDADCGPDPRNPGKQLVCRSKSCGIADVVSP